MLKIRFKTFKRDGSDVDDSAEFFFAVVRHWKFIALFTLGMTLVGFLYGESKSLVYEASIYLRAPTFSETEKFNSLGAFNEDRRRFEVEDIFAAFAHSVKSDSLKLMLYESVKSTSHMSEGVELDYETFMKSINVLAIPSRYVDGIKSASSLGLNKFFISYRASSKDEAINGLEQYIRLVERASVGELVSAYEANNDSIVAMYKSKIKTAREVAEFLRLDTISQLKDSLRLARAGGIVEPFPKFIPVYQIVSGDITYLKGARVIEEEIRILEGKKDNKIFTPDIRLWQSKIDLYSSLDVDEEALSAFSRNSLVEVVSTPSRVERVLTVLLAAMLGCMLSIVLVLVFFAFGRIKSQR